MVQEIECCEEVLQVWQVRVRGIQEIHIEVTVKITSDLGLNLFVVDSRQKTVICHKRVQSDF